MDTPEAKFSASGRATLRKETPRTVPATCIPHEGRDTGRGGAFPRASCNSTILEKQVLIPVLMIPLLPLTSKGLGSHL